MFLACLAYREIRLAARKMSTALNSENDTNGFITSMGIELTLREMQQPVSRLFVLHRL
jgi:hypothetical protein